MEKQPKFKIGQIVRFVRDTDSDAGKVLSYSFDGSDYVYRVSSNEVDIAAKKVVSGVKVLQESEIVAVELEKSNE